jgi:ketosteroid isomerase-like protein
MITNQAIIESIESYCRSTGMAETTFGKKVVNDGKLLSRLRDGKSISIETYNRITAEVEASRKLLA